MFNLVKFQNQDLTWKLPKQRIGFNGLEQQRRMKTWVEFAVILIFVPFPSFSCFGAFLSFMPFSSSLETFQSFRSFSIPLIGAATFLISRSFTFFRYPNTLGTSMLEELNFKERKAETEIICELAEGKLFVPHLSRSNQKCRMFSCPLEQTVNEAYWTNREKKKKG